MIFRCSKLRVIRNDLYCVEWGVKLYSLTHLRVIHNETTKLAWNIK